MSAFDPEAFAPPLRVPQLPSPPVVLRPFASTDLSMVRQAAADALIASTSSVPRPYTDDAGRAYIERQRARAAEGDGFSFVIAHHVDPEVGLGSIGLWLQEIESGRASIGYWLVAGARGRGLAARALETVVAFAFAELAIPRLHLFVEPWNVARRRAQPKRPGSPARRPCADGSASMGRSATPTASPSCTTSGPAAPEESGRAGHDLCQTAGVFGRRSPGGGFAGGR